MQSVGKFHVTSSHHNQTLNIPFLCSLLRTSHATKLILKIMITSDEKMVVYNHIQ